MENTNNAAIGMRLEEMYHTAVFIREMASKLIGNSTSDCDVNILWAMQELAQGQARELDALAGYLGGVELGYYADRFKDNDAAVIITNLQQGASA